MSNVNEHASRLLLRATPRVLSIAGTDPTGGAGIQADLKSIAANGGYGMAVVTALVAQNTHGVLAVHTPSVEFLRQQLDAVSHDVQIDAVKIGMLAELAVIDEVRSWLQTTRPPLVVLDPVMVSTSGDRLLAASAEQALRNLVSLVDLVTPNLPELAVLLQEEPAANWAEALEQGKRLSTATGVTVLVKGGHLTGADCPDALVNSHGLLAETVVEFVSPRVVTNNTHGTGCSLSSAMATVQAQTGDWAASLSRVKEWLNDALAHAHSLEVGSGNGPIHHFHQLFADRAPRGREFSESLWAGITSIRSRIFELPFIVALGNGTLDGVDFAYYLAQDAVCLNTYSHVLTRASRLAPTEEEQRFWANSAQLCLEVEAELHRSWVGDHPQPAPGLVTKGYLDHLLAVGVQGSYAVVVAALLPRFWLNAELGERLQAEILAQGRAEAHPYAAWLETYSNQAFVESARRAVAFVDAAAAAASSGERQNMKAVFEQSSQFELDFFDSPRLHARL
ncbi:MAG: bifunctional hydroxymethylpyrimidine kinase/phosphomethylpyrimidine kinase [Microcella sp.]|uniref:bifunctional hydroxymethylpyrimidine kinase/phosphomethylpyrimidine kinase n=1 Tax=Microcella sp. TaxID=1913979 RepID=UPI00271E6810|nr:bifunctional hydroxymethylpyrimidine kinase/phosphomethylpyrimidine kinase [Microcella sp.]MDO8337200.1 bifunctional hydroxymethylpyrimidine kinase/phosphomethylpyrimidine kinase [Microcella sp.]